jgi:protein-disulfide isomerase
MAPSRVASRPRALRGLVAAVAVATFVALGVAGCALEPSGGSSDGGSSSSAPLPTGTVGAAHLDDGYLVAGTGEKTVDVYLDPMCPICGVFEQTNGDQLTDLVDAGTITLRLHTMTFLNRASQGTDYSTRAAAALTCVAAADTTPTGETTLKYLGALFENQPEENSEGLTDAKLIDLASGVGAPDITSCVTDGTYQGWVNQANDDALSGPIEGADIKAVVGTPTVLVNGKSFTGKVNDAKALAAFIAAQ